VEDAARGQAVTRLRMDTRGDLAEARHLYATNGYREVPRSTTVVSLITGTE